MTMKLACVTISFALLCAGCYSQTAVTKVDILNLDNEELTFFLTDGSHIVSRAGQHHRVENGFEVEGRLVKVWPHTPDPWNPHKSQPSGRMFSGMVLDKQINEIAVSQLNIGLTILGIGVPLAVACVVVVGVSALDFHFTMSGW